ncbi:MAG: hypothetical protein ACI86H_001568 [bacterium]|jgi:hypothetical protein
MNKVCILGIDLILGKGVPQKTTLFGAFIVLMATIVIQFEKKP